MDIRPATADDEPAVLALIAQLGEGGPPGEGWSKRHPGWESTFRDLVSRERGLVLLAEEDGDILGTITSSYNLAIRHGGEYAQIEELFVSAAARGRDLGRGLVEACIAAARDRGCAEIGLFVVRSENVPFYEKCGFQGVGAELRLSLR